eukprot:scaffold50211_cov219-Isochrysis_galbana.AAC.1
MARAASLRKRKPYQACSSGPSSPFIAVATCILTSRMTALRDESASPSATVTDKGGPGSGCGAVGSGFGGPAIST